MPLGHGIRSEVGKLPFMCFKIMEIFRLAADPALNEGGRELAIESETHRLRLQFSQEGFHHFSIVLQRFLDSLDIFQLGMIELTACYSGREKDAFSHMNVQRRAGMAADSCLHYLGLLLDSIGRLIPLVVLPDPEKYCCYSKDDKIKCDSLYAAMQLAIRNSQFAAVKSIFEVLNEEGSWWYLGYKRGVGMRQRITHYPDLVDFHGVGKIGSGEFEAVASLRNAVSPQQSDVTDFVAALRNLLRAMCDWLDGLDCVLFEILSARAAMHGHHLERGRIHGAIVPVNFSEERELPGADFLFLPMVTCWA